MTNPNGAPVADLRRVADAQRRFEDAMAGFDEAKLRRPSLLPDWPIANVLTHVAWNADSHTRRAEAAIKGEVVDQYPGGVEQRTREIEEGASRSAADILDDVRTSGARLQAAWEALPEDVWGQTSRDVRGRERPLRDLPSRRWQELEVHAVDLGTGVTHLDWSDEFVAAWLPHLRASLNARLPAGASAPAPGTLQPREELAWLYGRVERNDLPRLAPWG